MDKSKNKENLRILKEFEDYYARLHPNEKRNITQLVWGENNDKTVIWGKKAKEG